ncbi:LADA_0C08174g1_1 [Lachancea dasiensis]|uniref:LADA_0C08174g1_1 n=1 Tax=Lachancea dasiensis TaxID=1072105 RepID=A0A1G4J0F3_9SACH|nr:LADA_0C08174g1_1 [Lachancea dasiensis]
MSSISVRFIEESDKDQWLRLWKGYLKFYKSSVSDQATEFTFTRFLDPNVKMWSAVAIDLESGAVVGFANYLSHMQTWDVKDKIYLNDLFVDESIRSKGVGRALINHVYDHADKLGTPNVYWSTATDNHRAQLLYTKVGRFSGFVKYVRS